MKKAVKKNIQKDKLPEKFKKYFWDVDAKKLDVNKYLFYVTERILEFGNPESLRWLFTKTDNRFIKHVVAKSRALSPRTINYWKLYFNA